MGKTPNSMTRAVFLDRDGTINEEVIYVLTGHGQEQLEDRDKWEVKPDHIAPDLLSAVQWIPMESES